MSILIELLKNTTQSGLFLHEVIHVLFVLPFLILIWIKTKQIKFVIAALVTAYLMDLDHLFDYWGYFGFTFNLVDFFKMEYFSGPGTAFVPFHAWEWLLVLGYFSYRRGWKTLVTPMTLGMASHLVWDAIAVKSALFYFISYRVLNGFRIFM